MIRNGLKIVVLFLMMSVTCVYGGEAKGYKIVLASFPNFDDAKVALKKVGEKLSAQERTLQKSEAFEIVARPSGKAFIVAIEPIQTREGSDKVLKQFKKLYPDAYANGYFGPTAGSIVLGGSSDVEVNTTETPIISSEENITVAPVAEEAPLTVVHVVEKETAKEEGISSVTVVIGGVVILLLLSGALFIRKGKSHPEVESSVALERESSLLDDEVIAINNSSSKENDSLIIKQNDEALPNDIFYTFKKNIFFATLLKELQSSAQRKDYNSCNDIMDEVMRYQKNFHKSEILATMKKQVETKECEKLLALISSHIDKGV